MAFDCVSRTHVGCKRKLNEDALLSAPDVGLWAVADGMGGHEAGEIASALVIQSLAGVGAKETLEAQRAAVEDALSEANARLVAMGAASQEPRTIGSTVVAVGANTGGYWCLWAGDSRAYRIRDGVLRQLTRDHSLVQELVDAGVLDEADAASHPNANVIRRAVGAASLLTLDLVFGDVADGDVFLLASDGLTRLAHEAEILEAILDGDLSQAADRLVQLCLDRGAPDNLTLVLVAT